METKQCANWKNNLVEEQIQILKIDTLSHPTADFEEIKKFYILIFEISENMSQKM